MAGKEQFTFFYKSHSPFSQWHPCTFSADGVEYNCAEQYMMHQKAVLFGDSETGKKILAAGSPRTQKSLGRKVQNFDDAVWKANCRRIVADGNYLKFTQNEHLLCHLMNTKGTTLVEASPRDKIWGALV
ncbi:hypothetical protein EB796_014790 [Bugula neritina]|uniref:NADAR domain-containing protein n=1 Tax=Bugula neritina TaxID=10212 RepID=A0A7J7JN90_BUGNE|nr:hypothetical protein EB796_014790 [Bugula neritina]